MLRPTDRDRLSRLSDTLRRASTEQAVAMVLPDSEARAALVARSRLDHVGVLVFPDSLEELADFLIGLGIRAADPVPSTVVAQRLRRRYRLDGESRVWIVRGEDIQNPHSGREIEVFTLISPPGSEPPPHLIARESQEENETHLAFRVEDPAEDSLEWLRRLVTNAGGMVPDSGGHNPHHPAGVGTSVLYFSRPGALTGNTVFHRMELTCTGRVPRVLAAHQHAADLLLPAEERRTAH